MRQQLEELVLACVRREHLALLIDVDGTLIPFADSLEEAVLDRAGANVLDALAFTGIQVVVVSGRPVEHVDILRASVRNLWCSAEHGAWWCQEGTWEGPPRESALDELAHRIGSLDLATGVAVERKTAGLCVHWRRVAWRDRPSLIETTRQIFTEWLGTHPGYEVLDGRDNIEVRHRSATKARAIDRVRRLRPDHRIIAIGDDATDEDMFAALDASEVGVCVRNGQRRETRAAAALSDSFAVREFLWWIIEVRSRRSNRVSPLELAR